MAVDARSPAGARPPEAMPTNRPATSATITTRSSALACCCHVASGSVSASAKVAPNASGASARARSRRLRSSGHSSALRREFQLNEYDGSRAVLQGEIEDAPIGFDNNRRPALAVPKPETGHKIRMAQEFGQHELMGYLLSPTGGRVAAQDRSTDSRIGPCPWSIIVDPRRAARKRPEPTAHERRSAAG